jgi:two-component system, OmpR family, alkaline phosphatase synthesis response regulator PhoP
MTTPINILIVGDDEATCTYLAKILSASAKEDWRTDIAWIGSTALELARNGAYDAVVFDYRKPGLDGAEVCRLIRQALPSARRVFVTGTPGIDTVYRAMEAGADRVLAKPVEPAELVHVLEEQLAELS